MATNVKLIVSIVADSIKETNLQVKARLTGIGLTKTVIAWRYYPIASPKNIVTVGTSTISGIGEATKKITKLNPNTEYVIEAGVVNIPVYTMATVRAKTDIMSRELVTEGTTASTIRMKLKGLKKYPYDRQVKFSIKKKSESNWEAKRVIDIPQGTNTAVTYLYTGLKKLTAYSIKAEYYRVEGGKSTRIGYTTRTVSTTAYTPNAKPIPYFTDHVVVPKVGGLVVSGMLAMGVDGNMNGFTAHLYSSEDDETYTDLGAWTDITKPKIITGDEDATVYYKVGVVDGNNTVYNLSDPLEITFGAMTFVTATQGNAFDITSEYMQEMCEAILASYKLRHYVRTGIYNIYDFDNEQYLNLKGMLGTIRDDMPVEGGTKSLMQAICDLAVYMDNHPGRVTPLDPITVGDKDAPITASIFNAMTNAVSEALDI